MMDKSVDVRRTVAALLAGQRLAVLATQGSKGPYASLVAFAATRDLRQLVFATTRATRKFANLTGDSRVALLVDSRSNRESDFHEAVGATVMGTAREATLDERERLTTLYLGRHPYLREFLSSPSCALVMVEVAAYYVVSRFQEVLELHIAP